MKSFIVLSCILAVAVASYVPADTPEVAAAKAQHFAAHAQANARNWASDVVVNNQWVAAAPAWNSLWAARANWYAPSWQQYYNPAQISVVNGHVQDTPEVAAEKAKHFALVAEAHARNGGAYVSGEDDGQWYNDVHSVPLVKSWVAQPAVSHSYVAAAPVPVKSYVTPTVVAARHHQPAHVVVANGHVQDTPEVAAEKAKHLSIFAQTAARDAAAGSTEWADNAENWKSWGPSAAISTYAAVAPVVSSVYPTWTGQPANIVVANGHVQDTAEVVAEKAKHFALVAEAKARNAASGGEWSEVVAPVVNHVAPVVVSRVAPVVSHVAPVAPVAAVADIHSQYHMPKGSALNSADKSKAKPAARISETNVAVKSGPQPQPLTHQGNQSLHGGHVKSDMPKTSGKLLVLKPGWENGVSSPTQKDIASSATITNNRVTTSQHAVAPIKSAPARNSNSPKLSSGELKAASVNPIAGFTVEKRPSLAQTQSRNDFFNLLKKKASTNTSAGLSDPDPHISTSTTEKSEVTKEVDGASATAHADENGTAAASNGDTCSDDGEKNMSATAMVYPDEEEAAFLRSLGWEENTGEDEGLTEEEINAFYQEYMKLRPSLKVCRGMQPKLSQSFANNLDGASELSSSDSGSET